jgi:hypothetical protein
VVAIVVFHQAFGGGEAQDSRVMVDADLDRLVLRLLSRYFVLRGP